jgi:hypothetical protein
MRRAFPVEGVGVWGLRKTASLFGRQKPPKEEMRHPKSGSAVAELVDNIVELHEKCKCFLFSIRKVIQTIGCRNVIIYILTDF